MIIKFIRAAIISILLSLAATSAFATPAESTIHALNKYKKATNPVYKIAKHKGTAGITPYYVINGKIFILLGQELTGGKLEASGTFSDFGGTITPDGKTVLQHALREYKEETMGQLKLTEDDVINSGHLLYIKTDKGRDVYYIFVKLTDKQYAKSKKMHPAKIRLKASGVPNSYLEKETFLWVSLDDLMNSKTETANAKENPGSKSEAKTNHAPENIRFNVHTPEGKSMTILVRGYYLRDCLENPGFPSFVKKLPR